MTETKLIFQRLSLFLNSVIPACSATPINGENPVRAESTAGLEWAPFTLRTYGPRCVSAVTPIKSIECAQKRKKGKPRVKFHVLLNFFSQHALCNALCVSFVIRFTLLFLYFGKPISVAATQLWQRSDSHQHASDRQSFSQLRTARTRTLREFRARLCRPEVTKCTDVVAAATAAPLPVVLCATREPPLGKCGSPGTTRN